MLFRLILYSYKCNVVVVIIFKKWHRIKIFVYYTFFHRLAQMRERGILYRIRKHHAVSKEPKEQPSTIYISIVTAAPNMSALAAGYIKRIFVLLIERCVHGNILKCWTRGSVRRWRKNENLKLLYN